jgi:hypothetical protein
LSQDFNTHAVAFCKCGRLMTEVALSIITCINPACAECGVDYEVAIKMTALVPQGQPV